MKLIICCTNFVANAREREWGEEKEGLRVTKWEGEREGECKREKCNKI